MLAMPSCPTLSEPLGVGSIARYLFPSVDAHAVRSVVELAVTAPAACSVVASGHLQSLAGHEAAGTRTHTFRMAAPLPVRQLFLLVGPVSSLRISSASAAPGAAVAAGAADADSASGHGEIVMHYLPTATASRSVEQAQAELAHVAHLVVRVLARLELYLQARLPGETKDASVRAAPRAAIVAPRSRPCCSRG